MGRLAFSIWSGVMLAALPVGAAAIAQPTRGPSVFQSAPNDPRAVTVRAKGDGVADDSAALQQAIDTASAKPGGGIVFLPAGKYRITRTLFIWPGVRVFGVGRTRPVLMLAANTPGFQRGVGTMVLFAGNNPRGVTLDNWGNPIKGTPTVPVPPPNSVPFDASIADANSGTFYSALSNVDFEIGEGNPAATGVRQHTAQHTYLAHIDFRLGSALAGVYQVGNLGMDLRFFGGRYGILAEKTSPAWQYTLLDSTFDGQRDAAIREHDASFTLVNTLIRNTPVGIDIDRGHSDRLWGSDVRFENVSQAGVVISNEGSVFTQIGFAGALASNTPTFARFRDSGRTVAGKGARYRVGEFTHGLTVDGLNQPGSYQTRFDAAPITSLPKRRDPAIRALPPVSSWVDVRTLGVKGDNTADDTQAIQRAIDRNRVLYFPAGFYRVTHTLKLRPDTVLIGLHPGLTQIVLPDDLPNYRDVGSPKALIESAKGGDAIVSGVGLFTGGVNPRATAMLWRAGERSLVDDVKFQGGHGTTLADGSRFEPYNPNHTADADVTKRWDGQFSSLWVTDNGGGTFNGLWTPNTYAHAGLYVSNTSTPGHVYEMSAEHHARAEIVLDGVRNWNFYAPQTEEEAGESRNAVALEVRNSRNILFANFHGYRVTRSIQPAPAAVKLYGSTDIRFRNVHVNAESGVGTCDENGCGTFLRLTKYPFENAIQDITHGLEVREREFAVLDVSAKPDPVAPSTFGGASVRKLADGFYGLGGGAVDAQGRLYFVDRFFQRIWRWSDAGRLEMIRDAALDPVNLTIDKSGNLLVLSSYGRNGTVYSVTPGAPDTQISVIPATPAAQGAAATIFPVNWWVNGEFRDQIDPKTYAFTTLAEMFARDAAQSNAQAYVSPDGSIALPAWRVFAQGPVDHRGLRFSHTLDSYGFVQGKPGQRIYVTNGSENRTYSALVAGNGTLTDLKPFADRGGEGVVSDAQGRVYVANGQVFVYAPDGKPIGRIDVPERPLQLLFGGPDGKTLFMLSHHGLYAARVE